MTLQIEISKRKEFLIKVILKLCGGRVISENREDAMEGIKQSLKEVKAIREGKMEPLSMSDLLSE